MSDGPAAPIDLDRFVRAQETGDPHSYAVAIADLHAARKDHHWIWYVFPQAHGLGSSPTAVRYWISGLDEARAYLAHPVLGARLRECCDALLAHEGRSAVAILGDIDAIKVRSSMTLFALADPDEPRFRRVLEAFYDGQPDPRTEAIVAGG